MGKSYEDMFGSYEQRLRDIGYDPSRMQAYMSPGGIIVRPLTKFYDRPGSDVTTRDPDFTSISTQGETVNYDGVNTTYQVITSGIDGTIAVMGPDHALLIDVIQRAERKIPEPIASKPSVRKPVPPVVIRIGDTERNATADALSTHFEQGRLTISEFQERTGKALAATGQPELDALLTDLPAVTTRVAVKAKTGVENIRELEELTARVARQQARIYLLSAMALIIFLVYILSIFIGG